jgi:hypothetical protein
MATIFSIFFNTKTTFQRIQEKSTTNIDLNNILLFILLGVFGWTTTYFQDNLNDLEILFEILAFVLSVSFSVVFAKYLINYFFLWISRLLKGSATKLEIETILAYSLIPKLFTFPLALYFGLTDSYANFTEIDSLIAMTIDIVALIFGIKIMLQGLMIYNGFGLIKALITMSPMIILLTAYYFRLIW